MKASEFRERSEAELGELETKLRDQLLRLGVAKATQRAANLAQFSRLRRDIARIKTIQRERQLGIGQSKSKES